MLKWSMRWDLSDLLSKSHGVIFKLIWHEVHFEKFVSRKNLALEMNSKFNCFPCFIFIPLLCIWSPLYFVKISWEKIPYSYDLLIETTWNRFFSSQFCPLKNVKNLLTILKKLLKFLIRSIFQNFWKQHCVTKSLFYELDTSNFGYLLFFWICWAVLSFSKIGQHWYQTFYKGPSFEFLVD